MATGSVSGRQRNTDAYPNVYLVTIDGKRLFQDLDQLMSQLLGFCQSVMAGLLNDRKLVASQARNEVALFQQRLHALARLYQQGIACRMAKRIVHRYAKYRAWPDPLDCAQYASRPGSSEGPV